MSAASTSGPYPPRGRLITFEGGEGGGKTTQRDRLVAWLEGQGIACLATREPGGDPGAEAIRELLVTGDPGRWDPIAETLLHAAARRMHVSRTILPALEAGRWVVSDRFADSTRAYQGAGLGVDAGVIEALIDAATGGLAPDLTLVLDVPVDIGIGRAGRRRDAADRYERMAAGFHDRVRRHFLAIAAREPGRCRVVDAGRPVEAVFADIIHAVTGRLGVGQLEIDWAAGP